MVLYWVPMKGAFLHTLIRYRAMQPLNLSGHREAVDADSTVHLSQTIATVYCATPDSGSPAHGESSEPGVFLFAEPNIV